MQFLIRSLLLLMAFVSHMAFASPVNFEQATFDALQKEGKPVLVVIHADWCPTCRAQAPLISELVATPEFKAVQVMRVDFDARKDVVKAMKATMQSTLIVFKGGREVGRSVGDTRKEGIAALLKKAL
ncbi:MAG: thioredoxin family protein [Dechloromonas sp.]|nr:MAG: thioredoxin family protein [Dechloromonas sp.]